MQYCLIATGNIDTPNQIDNAAPMLNLVVDCLRSRASLDQLKGVWQTLERTDPQCTPFSSWMWADAWWREFELESSKLRILIVKSGREVVGICPLHRHTTKHYGLLSLTSLSLLGALPGVQSTHPGVIAHPKYRKRVESAVLRHLPKLKGWDTLDLSGLDANSSFATLARQQLRRKGGVMAVETTHELVQESLRCSWSEYRSIGGGQRALELKQLSNAVTAMGSGPGACELSICSTRQELNESLEVFYSLIEPQAEKGHTPEHDRAARERFFRQLVPEFFLADMLWQLTLRIDGRIVGVQHYFVWRGDLLLFQEAYTPTIEKRTLTTFMLAYAIKRGMGQALEQVRIHTQPFEFADVFVSKAMSVSQLRFTPSRFLRVVEKMLKTRNKS